MRVRRFKLKTLSVERLRPEEMNAIIDGNSYPCSGYWADKDNSSM